MKKAISLFLALLLTAALLLPALAVDPSKLPYSGNDRIPVIMIGGDGEPLYNAEGEHIFTLTELGKLTEKTDKKDMYEAVANVLQPFLLEGVLFNRWDNYYKNLEKEIGELTGDIKLDADGNPSNGSHISPARYEEMKRNMQTDKSAGKGYYDIYDYCFWYDWRLDPLLIADQLNDYIDGVLAATGAEKVAIVSRCIGTTVAVSYAAKYGTSKLNGVGLDGSCTAGGEFISDALSGNFKLDGNAIGRFLTDYDALGMLSVSEFALASLDLLTKSGALDAVTGISRETIYKKIMQGATSALALSTLFTMPCYWCFVTADRYEAAKTNVFGAPGSEKRQQYAGLIEKLDVYHNTVRLHLSDIMRGFGENGVNTGVISKYGFQIVPICASGDAVADQYASVTSSSFGATASTLYDTLPEDYVAGREAEGKGRYISSDRQVDASTCLYPDSTWFIKGARHGNWLSAENEILYTVTTADRQLTTADLPYTQFIVYNDAEKTVSPMTAENCHTEYWTADPSADHPKTVFERLKAFFDALIRWFRALFKKDKR